MKKCVLKISIAVITMMAAVSCGGKQEAIEKMISASNVEITGSDANGISITGDIKLFMVQNEHNPKRWSIRALVPLTNNMQYMEIDDIYSSGFDLLDANYSEINDDFGLHIQNEELAISMLTSVEGTKKNIVFEPVWESISYRDYKTIVDFINRTENITFNFMIADSNSSYSSSSYNASKDSYSDDSTSSYNASNDENNESSSSESSSNDWDSVLDEYEKYVDEYISMYKKAMAGDVSALSSYIGLLESAEKLSDKLDDAEDDMTTSQMNRYMKITQKMTSAALDALDE